jgi:hypothetical protein
MPSSRSDAWDRVRSVEALLALVAQVEQHRVVIRRHAWREGSWHQVFVEATQQGRAVAKLQACISERWHELMDEAQV